MNAIEWLKTVNSFARTMIAAVVLGAVSVAGWFGYTTVQGIQGRDHQLQAAQQQLRDVSQALAEKKEQVLKLESDLQKSNARIDQLETAMHLLKVDHRLAEIVVLDQGTNEETGTKYSIIEFAELNDSGQRIDKPRQFRLAGERAYVDYWVVKFDDKYVEGADLDRATSICLFRGIHSENKTPSEAYRLDTVGTRPTAYSRGRPMSDFEKQIWSDFWDIANDQDRAREKGIRAAHGEEAYIELRKGKTYRLELRASGGLTIKPAQATRTRTPPVEL